MERLRCSEVDAVSAAEFGISEVLRCSDVDTVSGTIHLVAGAVSVLTDNDNDNGSVILCGDGFA